MTDVISDYQKWKQQGESLRGQAKQAMESRFRDLLAEAVRIAEEYRADFGLPLKPASPVTTFRYKAAARPKVKKGAKAKVAPAPPARQEPASRPDPKLAGLQKQLATATRKLEAAKAAAKPTRNLEDKIYEIEDALRLATQL